jgi:hypothetical protein
MVLERVRHSEPETVEGRRARECLRAIEAMLRRLAHDSEEPAILDPVEEFITTSNCSSHLGKRLRTLPTS